MFNSRLEKKEGAGEVRDLELKKFFTLCLA